MPRVSQRQICQKGRSTSTDRRKRHIKTVMEIGRREQPQLTGRRQASVPRAKWNRRTAGEVGPRRGETQRWTLAACAFLALLPALRVTAQTLHDATLAGDMAKVREHLASGADPDARDHLGRTALHVAVSANPTSASAGAQLGIASLLLQAGARPGIPDFEGQTPLSGAAARCNAGAVSLLLAGGAAVNVRDESGRTPLQLAARSTAAGGDCNPAVTRLLLAGANVHARDERGRTAMHGVTSPDVVRTLAIAAGGFRRARDEHGRSPFFGVESPAVLQAMQEVGGRVSEALDDDGQRPLHFASRNGETVKALVSAGIDVNALDEYRRTPLHRTARLGSLSAVEALLGAGADVDAPDAWGATPLHSAVEFFTASTEDRPPYQANITRYSLRRSERTSVIQRLLASGARLDIRDQAGRTPLHVAAERGAPMAVQSLLAAGSEVDAVDANGQVPLHWAIFHPVPETREAIVRVLLNAGANRHARATDGSTPLERANRGILLDDSFRSVVELLQASAPSTPIENDDHGNNRSTATPLTVGETASGVIETGTDQDYFRLDTGDSISITLFTSGRTDTVGTLIDTSSFEIASDDDGGTDLNFRISANVSSGIYYVRVETVGKQTGRYTLHAVAGAGGAGPGSRVPGAVFKDCARCPRMTVIPPGTFQMGSPEDEEGRENDEGPVHEVRITSAFAVGIYEVTFQEWDACVDAGGCGGYRPDDEGWGRGDRPVINVSWNDARAYVAWLNDVTGKMYRLLSEAEWEYAARAGTHTPYHFGDRITESEANFGESKPLSTQPVGSYTANGFGLHDMHGNAWEWVEDCYYENYDGAPVDGSAWTTGNCTQRGLRSGSSYFPSRYVRSANRGGLDPTFRGRANGFGIRVAQSLDP